MLRRTDERRGLRFKICFVFEESLSCSRNLGVHDDHTKIVGSSLDEYTSVENCYGNIGVGNGVVLLTCSIVDQRP